MPLVAASKCERAGLIIQQPIKVRFPLRTGVILAPRAREGRLRIKVPPARVTRQRQKRR